MADPIGIHPPNLATDENGDPILAPVGVVLTFPDTLVAGTPVNVQTGIYAGGGPATVEGDVITLGASGAEFVDQGILVSWNGQLLDRGNMLGSKEAQWVSSTQLAFSSNVLAGNKISIQVV